jgi:succinyl-diaminopimelate desuccinylase
MLGGKSMKKDEVLDYLDLDYVVSLTKQLIRIPSETARKERSKDRAPLVTLIDEQFKPLGLETKHLTVVEGRPNIYAEITGDRGGPTLVLQAHAGTVDVSDMNMELWTSDPFEPEIRDGKLYGLGSSDDKGGVAAVIGVVKAIVESGIGFNGKIGVLILTHGEGEPGGTRQLIQQNLFPKADANICVDASDRKIVTQYKGMMYYEFVVHGKFVHCSMPEKGINAAEKMCEVIRALKDIRFTEHDDPVLGKVDFTVTSIDCINIRNSVPGRCKMTADMRMIPGLTSEQAKGKIQAVLDNLTRNDKELNVVMNVVPDFIREACGLPLDHPIVQATAQAMEKIVGQAEYTPGVMSGSGFWLLQHGIPSVFFGPGNIAVSHMPNEYTEVPRLEEATKIIALAALNYLGVTD